MSKIKDFMTTPVVTVSAKATLAEAARLMRDNDVGFLPVVDGDDLKGVVTDRDLVVRGLADGNEKSIGEIVSGGVIFLRPDDDEKEAEKLMSANNVRRLPVVDNGRLAGMVSVGDLAASNDGLAGKVMENTGPG
ncbi:MAG: CBS domain-containing protein [Tepidiformaceae bacterium]